MPCLHFSHHLQWIEDDAPSTSSVPSVVGAASTMKGGMGFVMARVEVAFASVCLCRPPWQLRRDWCWLECWRRWFGMAVDWAGGGHQGAWSRAMYGCMAMMR